jgi:cytochrome c oxidase subunit 1
MPWRLADLAQAFAGWSLVASIGAYIGSASTLLFVFIVFPTLLAGRRAGTNPGGRRRDYPEVPAALAAAVPHL